MQQISKDQVIRRLQAENCWWGGSDSISEDYAKLRRRAYFELLFPLISAALPKRAVLLMGPRRVGKTVMMQQVVQQLISEGVAAKNICYFSVDHPIYNGLGLEKLLELYFEAAELTNTNSSDRVFVLFDEIQYLKDWEIHLKSLVDRYSNIKFLVSGSSAAALKLKSDESGAGRFTDFLLPPLTFHEYIDLSGQNELITVENNFAEARDIVELNKCFLNYLNFGGYPEVMFSELIQSDPGRFIKSDIIDRVLLRDLPSLYGIQDIQELNYLFTTLAFNTANEVSLEDLSQSSGVAKNTIKRYIEYLEAAFLVKIVHRIDRNANHFQRANFFKIYLTNPSMWSALFETLSTESRVLPYLAETAIFSQWFHIPEPRYYARWSKGEVDIVGLHPGTQKPMWAIEVKWSNRYSQDPKQLRSLLTFCTANKLKEAVVTTLTDHFSVEHGGIELRFVPTSIYCWTLGHNIVKNKQMLPTHRV
ncbi:MAG: ATP-binding protein [Blastocatellia bacterium]|nr:ATP-binding protein [Blastocatellia bacterium]